MKLIALIFFFSLNVSAFDYFQYGGLVTQNDPQTENMNLFLAEYLTVGGHIEKSYFENGMADRLTVHNLYLRSPIHTTRTVSHDEILGWMVTSKILGTNHRFELWEQLVDHGGSYPAVFHDWTDFLPYNPANYYVWAMLSEHENVAQIYLPFYVANLVITANKDYNDTSSKILTWLELSNMPMSYANDKFITYFDKKMTEMYGREWLSILLRLYHNKETEDFPIFEALNENIKQ